MGCDLGTAGRHSWVSTGWQYEVSCRRAALRTWAREERQGQKLGGQGTHPGEAGAGTGRMDSQETSVIHSEDEGDPSCSLSMACPLGE